MPRFGMRLIRAFPQRIAMLHATHQGTTNKHVIYVLAQNSFLYSGAITEIGTAAGVNMTASIPLANWNSETKNAASAIGTSDNPTATESRLMFSIPGFGVAPQQVYDQTGGKVQFVGATDVKGIPWSHGNNPAVLQKRTVVWSDFADAYTWPVANFTHLPPEIGEGIAAAYWQEEVSYIFGTLGVASVQGTPLVDARWTVLTAPPAAGPVATCVARCRDRIAYMAPGPAIYLLGGGLQRIDGPIQPILSSYGDATQFTMSYDPLIDCLCLSPIVDQALYAGRENDTFLFNVSEGRWVGSYRNANGLKGIQRTFNAGPQTDSLTVPRNRPPFGLQLVACEDLLCRYDDTLFADHDASANAVAFECAIETSPEGADPETAHLDKKLMDVYVDGTGRWDCIAKVRNGSGETYTEILVGSVDAPGWIHASRDLRSYRERIVRLEASSASNLRIRGVGIRERAVGG